MNLDEIAGSSSGLDVIKQWVDDPFTLLMVLGLSGVIFMLVLLRMAFSSMNKADQRTKEMFENKD